MYKHGIHEKDMEFTEVAWNSRSSVESAGVFLVMWGVPWLAVWRFAGNLWKCPQTAEPLNRPSCSLPSARVLLRPRGGAASNREALGDAISEVGKVVFKRVTFKLLGTLHLTSATIFDVRSRVCTFLHSGIREGIRDIVRTRWCVEFAWSKGMPTPAYSALSIYEMST